MAEPPPLALSDIMHPFTPSPPHDEDGEDPPSPTTPEPLDQAEIEAIKERVKELAIGPLNDPDTTSREQELAKMVSTKAVCLVVSNYS